MVKGVQMKPENKHIGKTVEVRLLDGKEDDSQEWERRVYVGTSTHTGDTTFATVNSSGIVSFWKEARVIE